MTYNLLYKVGNSVNFKTYAKGEFSEIHKVFNALRERAAKKSFSLTCRSQGCLGVVMTYSNGKESVQFVVCDDDELKSWWSDKVVA